MCEACWNQLRSLDEDQAKLALTCIVKRYALWVDAFLRRVFRLPEPDRDDIAQVLWMKLWDHRKRIGDGTEGAWLFTVALNEAKSFLRNRGRLLILIPPEDLAELVAEDCDQGCDPDGSAASAGKLVQRVRALISTLNSREVAIIDAWSEGDPVNWRTKVAEELAMSTTNVGVVLNRIKKRIKKRIKDILEDEKLT